MLSFRQITALSQWVKDEDGLSIVISFCERYIRSIHPTHFDWSFLNSKQKKWEAMEAMTVHRYTKPSYLAGSKFLPHAHRAFFCVLSSYIIIIIMLFSCVCSQSCDWCAYTKKKMLTFKMVDVFAHFAAFSEYQYSRFS